MKERPILFSTAMVQAILADRKKVTRRMKGLESKNEHPDNWHRTGDPQKYTHKNTKELPKDFSPLKIEYGFKTLDWKDGDDLAYAVCPYGMPGDLLWVRETFTHFGEFIIYKADKNDISVRWSPSIHMPKEAARIWLKITKIKAERLKDISEKEAIKEGIDCGIRTYHDYLDQKNCWSNPIDSFRTLWQSINGLDSWDQNPWVWAISFEVVSKKGRP
jgi:hypothetical protein